MLITCSIFNDLQFQRWRTAQKHKNYDSCRTYILKFNTFVTGKKAIFMKVYFAAFRRLRRTIFLRISISLLKYSNQTSERIFSWRNVIKFCSMMRHRSRGMFPHYVSCFLGLQAAFCLNHCLESRLNLQTSKTSRLISTHLKLHT